jgi:hypothetical protein
MASTYVNDLRLNEMATGDASGSWGTVTNTNLELIGEAFSYGTETIGDADSTLTIADGAADAARSFYLKITSSVDLTTTRIVTLAPNTVSKVWMIENATTGSQVITIKQGSGATINVPNGQVKMISTDGAGSGGAVLDLLVDVDLTGTTTLVNLDVSGAVTGTSATLTTADNTTQLTLKSTDDDVNSGPELDFYRLSASPADNDYLGRVKYIGRNDNAQDVTAVDILARMVDVSDGTEDATYNIRVMKAGTLIDRVTLNETETILNEASADLDFRIESDTDANALFVEGSSGNVGIGTSSPSGRLQISDTFPTFILDETNTDAAYQQTMLSLSDGAFRLQTRTSTNVFVSNDYTIEKDASGATDHIWSIADSEKARIDSSGKVGIGVSDPSELLEVGGATSNNYIKVSAANNSASGIKFRSDSSNTTGSDVGYEGDGNYLFFRSDIGGTVTNRMVIDNASGKVTIGTTTAAPITTELHVHKNAAGGDISFGDESTVVISTNATGAGNQGYIGSLWFGSQDISSVDQYGWKLAGMAGYMSGDTSATGGSADLLFYTADASQTGTERLRIDSSGHLIAPYGITLGTAVGTYAADNTLDDYEEGTWTPVIADATTGGNVGSATIANAKYTKVGNKVTIAAQITNIVTTGMTAANVFYVRGLPFLSATQLVYGACRPNTVTFQSTRTGVVVAVSVADTWASFPQYGSGISDTSTDVNDITSGTSDMNFSITYFT